MSVEQGSQAVHAAVGLLIEKLEQHAAVMADSDPEPLDAVTAEDAVRAAAVAYAETVMGHNGWGHPFNLQFADALEDEEGNDQDDHDVDEEPDVPDGEVSRLSVQGRWDFYVEDGRAWSEFVAERLGELGVSDCTPDLTDPGHALQVLMLHDDYTERFTIHGLRDGGVEVFAGEVERTLQEES
ncbi:hypothetical protein ACFVFS_22390 [Kitasatospora sp. NPDC057692]|uniref:hypothetical protein n=1 Tax=Kitasatospora sp. NPDC057692 TaxID=3346215 RepID=UPI00368F7E31